MKKFKTASGEPPVLHRNSANLVQNMLDEVIATVTIIPDLKALIPPLLTSEFDQLKSNILKEGCRDPLLIWQTTRGIIDGSNDNFPLNILIDGHNRYQICLDNNITFKVSLREFPTLSAVREFMIDNQLGRRNLTPEQMSYLRGLKYRSLRQETGRPTHEGIVNSGIEIERRTERTRERLAKEFNVSPRTIMRDREYSEGIDRLELDLKHEVLSGSRKLPKEVVREIGRVVAPEAARLSLPRVKALVQPEDSADEVNSLTINNTEITIMIAEITKLVTLLNPDHSMFNKQCDELIGLLRRIKK